jgi:hypothetical protein
MMHMGGDLKLLDVRHKADRALCGGCKQQDFTHGWFVGLAEAPHQHLNNTPTVQCIERLATKAVTHEH